MVNWKLIIKKWEFEKYKFINNNSEFRSNFNNFNNFKIIKIRNLSAIKNQLKQYFEDEFEKWFLDWLIDEKKEKIIEVYEKYNLESRKGEIEEIIINDVEDINIKNNSEHFLKSFIFNENIENTFNTKVIFENIKDLNNFIFNKEIDIIINDNWTIDIKNCEFNNEKVFLQKSWVWKKEKRNKKYRKNCFQQMLYF